eukprot:2148257-Rhodomonas_salina.2
MEISSTKHVDDVVCGFVRSDALLFPPVSLSLVAAFATLRNVSCKTKREGRERADTKKEESPIDKVPMDPNFEGIKGLLSEFEDVFPANL